MDITFGLDDIIKQILRGNRLHYRNEIIPVASSASSLTQTEVDFTKDQDVLLHLRKIINTVDLLLQVFRNNYDNSCSVFIENILNQVQNIFEFAVRSNFLLDFPLNQIVNIFASIVEIVILYGSEGNVKNLANVYSHNISQIKQKISIEYDNISPFTEELTARLRIVSVFYETIPSVQQMLNETKDCSSSYMKQLKELIRVDKNINEDRLFAKLIFINSEATAAQMLLSVIPKFIAFSKSNVLLQFIWEEISESLSLKNYVEYFKIFTALCYLSDYYYLSNNSELIIKIFKDKNYWILLQKGMENLDSTIRKQALYLFKISLQFMKHNKLSFKCFKIELNGKNDKNAKETPLMYCEPNKKLDEYDHFSELCTIMEYLEERQIHIVEPIFHSIQIFLEKYMCSTGELHFTWLIIFFKRMLSHDNMKIVKQGISCLLEVRYFGSHYDEEILMAVIQLLVSNLNCTQLYMNDYSTMLQNLKLYFHNCSISSEAVQFFKILIHEICSIRWSSEALFFIMSALTSVKKTYSWQKEELNLIKKLISDGTANHYTYIKSGMQCQLLIAGISLIDTSEVSLEEIASFLDYFHRKISLRRYTKIWNDIVNWIGNSCTEEDAENFISRHINYEESTELKSSAIAKMMVLLYDADLWNPNDTCVGYPRSVLENISMSFANIHARPYCNWQMQEFYMSLIYHVIAESLEDEAFMNIIGPYLSDIISYVELRLSSIHHLRDFHSGLFFTNILNEILHFGKKPNAEFRSIVNGWFEKNLNNLILAADASCLPPVQKFIKIKTLNVLIDYIGWNTLCCRREQLISYIKINLNSTLVKTTEEQTLTKDLQTLWGKMNSEYVEGNWQLLVKVIGITSKMPSELLKISGGQFCRLCLEGVDIGEYDALLPVMSAFGVELPNLVTEEGLRTIIDNIWRMINERKKNEEYCSLIKKFVEIIFRSELLVTNDEAFREILMSYCSQIFSSTTTKITNLFMQHLQKIKFDDNVIYFFSDVLPDALLYGQVQKKDERLISEICSFIETYDLSPLTNDCTSCNEVRCRAVKILMGLNSTVETHRKFAANLISNLIMREGTLSKNKIRYFSDSYVHRVKHRLMQCLLILEHYISQEESKKLLSWVCEKILIENNQPSVRYQQEWLVMKILSRQPNLLEDIWSYLDNGPEVRNGSVCSLISVIYHTVKFIPIESMATWVERTVRTLLPYCMAQHFSVRLYAQVGLQKMMDLAEGMKSVEITKAYSVITKSLEQSIERGNTMKNSAKLQEHFYFNVFHPVNHYSLETIFYELPRLSNVGSDEWIPVDLLLACEVEAVSGGIPLVNANDILKLFKSDRWSIDGSKQDFIEDSSSDKINPELSNFQKKIIPVKSLVPNWEHLEHSVWDDSKKYSKDGLILVASLINRIPNLGGLSRTCEIFGASELVIGSLKYVEDKEFQSLSVSADKWLRITEVKPFHLMEYLNKMKEKGYTIMAAEQTINSQPLQSVTFPKRSLLLLGNEKEGIPPTLLPVMDLCIEIPQMGIIRSLNVHVTGALFVWEYAKQHYFANQIKNKGY